MQPNPNELCTPRGVFSISKGSTDHFSIVFLWILCSWPTFQQYESFLKSLGHKRCRILPSHCWIQDDKLAGCAIVSNRLYEVYFASQKSFLSWLNLHLYRKWGAIKTEVLFMTTKNRTFRSATKLICILRLVCSYSCLLIRCGSEYGINLCSFCRMIQVCHHRYDSHILISFKRIT